MQGGLPNERIVDDVPLGNMTTAFEPDDGGTTMSMGWERAHDVPVAGPLIDNATWVGDSILDAALANVSAAVEG